MRRKVYIFLPEGIKRPWFDAPGLIYAVDFPLELSINNILI